MPNAEKKFVIEANLSDEDDSIRVNISKTLDWESTLTFNPIDNAVVTIQKDSFIPVLINGEGKGRYTSYTKTEVGATYTLTVEIDDQVFKAQCKMPKKVNIDSLFVTPSILFGKKKNLATLKFVDPPEPGNFYRFLLSTDGFDNTSIFVLEDRLINGRNVIHELNDMLVENDEHHSIDKHDWVRVEARCIDAPVYKYFSSLRDYTISPGPGRTPDNSVSNITGGALGYFSVHSYQLLEFISPY